MHKIIVWGTGEEYCAYIHRLHDGVEHGEFEVVGVTSGDGWYREIDGFRFIAKQEIMMMPHDYVLIASEKHFSEIAHEYVILGGNIANVLPIGVLNVASLTFSQYIELYESKVSIIANNCWGGYNISFFKNEVFIPAHKYVCLGLRLSGISA